MREHDTDGQRQELHVHLLDRAACMVVHYRQCKSAMKEELSHDLTNTLHNVSYLISHLSPASRE